MAPAAPVSIAYEDGSADPKATKPLTMYDKIWRDHLIHEADGSSLLFIDRHLVHEVTSPQAFEGLRLAHRPVRRPDCTLVTVDHNVPTSSRKDFKDVKSFIKQADSRNQVATLEENVVEFGLRYFGMDDRRQGIVHVIGPEQGFTLPGTTVVCGDSHTSTHGAFGALAFGIGTSEVEHVLATQTLPMKRSKNMRVRVNGKLREGITSKDVVLHIIGVIGTAGGTGSVIEFCGDVFEKFSMEARMSVCNMTIEAGARAGLVAPDDITFEYLRGRPLAPKGADWDKAVTYWRSLRSDEGAQYDKSVDIDAADIAPTVTWGTSPEDVVPITGIVPDPEKATDPTKKSGMQRALGYMGLEAGMKMTDVTVQKAFIGSCTNSRIEDMREVAKVIIASGKKVAPGVEALIVPGSGLVKQQAEAEGLDKIFIDAGFDWREPGCSMCLAMNPDKLGPQERCASTSNRNFEGRQGPGGRTHLMTPGMAAAAALYGKLTDVREIYGKKVTDQKANSKTIDSKFFTTDAIVMPEPAPEPEVAVASPEAADQGAPASATSGAGMPKFVVLEDVIAAPLPKANVDTDAIIPKQFLKTIKRTGLGYAAFFELRYEDDGVTEKSDFVLNQEPWRKATVLVAMENFGCGSSREHAPWAMNDFGIRCVIAPSFADIFFNNCFKNGMLPIALARDKVERLMAAAQAKTTVTVDLPAQKITIKDGEVFEFEVDSFRKHCLVNGLDDIGLTLQKKEFIKKYEAHRRSAYSWLESASRGTEVAEVRVSTSKNSGYYARMARGFLSGLPEDESRPARPPASRVLLSATGAAIDRAAQAAVELEASGDAKIAKICTDMVDPLKANRTGGVPQITITLDAPRKAKALAPAVNTTSAEGCGCTGKATDW